MSVAPDNLLRLAAIETFSTPFDYFVSPEALDENLSTRALSWLETEAPWKLVETDFYEQYEFSFWDIELPRQLEVLRDSTFLNSLKEQVGNLFTLELGDDIDVAAHKLIPGQRIRLHNDFISGHETARLLIQLNRDWHDKNGGLLLFFNSGDPVDVHKAFRPIHNTAVGFAVSPTSNHAVTTIHSAERFTLVYSFYGQNGDE
jgi:Rps23 Pro-64 3,4-dihydroxylase Tpa1-like proline 4-hydroxylase